MKHGLMITIALALMATAARADSLPPEVLADKYLIAAKTHMVAKRYVKARSYFKRILALKIRVPTPFYYHYGKVLLHTSDFAEARANLRTYIKKTGRKGPFYRQTLTALVAVDEGEAKQRKNKAAADRLAAIRANDAQKRAEFGRLRTKLAAALSSSSFQYTKRSAKFSTHVRWKRRCVLFVKQTKRVRSRNVRSEEENWGTIKLAKTFVKATPYTSGRLSVLSSEVEYERRKVGGWVTRSRPRVRHGYTKKMYLAGSNVRAAQRVATLLNRIAKRCKGR